MQINAKKKVRTFDLDQMRKLTTSLACIKTEGKHVRMSRVKPQVIKLNGGFKILPHIQNAGCSLER